MTSDSQYPGPEFGSNPMEERFWRSASLHARRAYGAYIEGDFDVLYRDAGTAVEHACKGTLAWYHPALVVGARGGVPDYDTLLWVLGFGYHARRPPSQMISIGCRDALRRCAVLDASLTPFIEAVGPLLDHRNSVVHLASLQGGAVNADRDAVVFVRLMNELLVGAAHDVDEFWGEFANAVRGRISESRDEEELRVSELISVARDRYRARYPPGSDAVLTALAVLVETEAEDEGIYAQIMPCPACAAPALVEGSIGTSGSPHVEIEGPDAYLDFQNVDVEFYPDELACLVCDLRLRGSELTAAGIQDKVTLEDVDPADYYVEQDDGRDDDPFV